MLPKLDGYEALRRLRARPKEKKLPVSVLAARGRCVDSETAFECGADFFMNKPFAKSEITAPVTRLAPGRHG